MPRLELLAEVQRKMLQMFPCMEHDDTPWTPLAKPLSESRLALVTTAGLHLRGDQPFVSDHRRSDTSYRVIPRAAKTSEILQSHTSIGFDHAAIYRDINVTFPVDRLQELVDRGKSWARWRRTTTRSWARSGTCRRSSTARPRK